ncbi:MAG TPA: hypothetical protein VN944_10535 [Nitrospiria bacterium]|nr:hypothetical protein [Nitrospiria bacterium]
MGKNKKDHTPPDEPRWIKENAIPLFVSSNERDELLKNRCSRCNQVTDKLYRMGTATMPMTICGLCRSEFVGE